MDENDLAKKIGAAEIWTVAKGFMNEDDAKWYFEHLVKNAYVCHIVEQDGKYDVWYR